MGEEKSARYTIILGVCLLLCLLMLGRMLVGRSESEAPPDGTEPVETVPEEQQEPQHSPLEPCPAAALACDDDERE